MQFGDNLHSEVNLSSAALEVLLSPIEVVVEVIAAQFGQRGVVLLLVFSSCLVILDR